MKRIEENRTKEFYNEYWPENVPDYTKTKQHIYSLLPGGNFNFVLDAGCGTGVTSLALSERAEKVYACDISYNSIITAKNFGENLNIKNIEFINGSILSLPFKSNSFDLILCWGVIHHTIEPDRAFKELVYSLRKEGCLIVAVYQKTSLTFLHEMIRKWCLRIKREWVKESFIKFIVFLVRILEKLGKRTNVRDDNVKIASQVEDWFFVPVKHFFTLKQLEDIFKNNNLTFEVLCEQTGRLKSSSNVIVRGFKK